MDRAGGFVRVSVTDPARLFQEAARLPVERVAQAAPIPVAVDNGMQGGHVQLFEARPSAFLCELPLMNGRRPNDAALPPVVAQSGRMRSEVPTYDDPEVRQIIVPRCPFVVPGTSPETRADTT